MKRSILPIARFVRSRVHWIITALLFVIVSASGAEKSPELPTFPGQPNMNSAYKKILKAQETFETKPEDALVHLKIALNQLEGSKRLNKGTYRSEAIRYTSQAITHLEKKDVATTRHDIDQALDYLIKAGRFADK